ncbi:hypothetical protein AzCIB_0061 [Azoarcus sp. CIB]|uniref:hypothetical protein n=1 Tax=Aromatoleum sp. (strain CIB) TaxID=198107 RepID=UPI00067B8854|nr:hypothetical protein [Azoarcus sp. CIB]AKU09966.1 hypothetical protein AzCIB_0061 [Azoarcus sp. CIB]
MKARIAYVIAAVFAAALLAGCGEQPQVGKYEQGKYAGKADTRPWEGGTFKGDKGAWEQAQRDRIRAQNEYKRVE